MNYPYNTEHVKVEINWSIWSCGVLELQELY